MKKTLFAALAAAVCGAMFAATDIVETMTVKLADGTEVEYEVSQVENVSFGTKEVSVLGDNFFKYYNKDGELTNQGDITGATKTVKSNGMWKVAFANEEGINIFVELEPSLVGKTVDFATAADNSYAFRYDMIQIYAPGNEWKPAGTNGSFTLTDNGDGTLTFVADVTNQYVSGGVAGGSPEHVVIAYTGACEGLEAAPQVKNEITFFNPDGAQENYTAVSAVTMTTTSRGLSKYAFTVNDEDLAADYGKKFYIELDPSLVGTTVDVPASTSTINCYFAFIQVSGPNDEFRPVAKAGTVKIVDNNDGNVNIEVDLTESSNRRVVFTYSGALTK